MIKNSVTAKHSLHRKPDFACFVHTPVQTKHSRKDIKKGFIKDCALTFRMRHETKYSGCSLPFGAAQRGACQHREKTARLQLDNIKQIKQAHRCIMLHSGVLFICPVFSASVLADDV